MQQDLVRLAPSSLRATQENPRPVPEKLREVEQVKLHAFEPEQHAEDASEAEAQ